MAILTLTSVYTGGLLFAWLSLGLIQGAVSGHRLFDDDEDKN